MKRKNGFAMAVVLGFALLLLIIGCAVLLVMDEKKASDEATEGWGESVVSGSDSPETTEWQGEEDVMEGDAPPDDYEDEPLTEGEKLELFDFPGAGQAKAALTALAEEYNEMIPFGYLGRSYSYGYFKQEEGYKNILYDNCSNGLGLDGLGYAIWIYRNAMGHTPQEFLSPFSMENLTVAVELSQLEVGDFCVAGDGETDSDYGVVCGFIDGHPVVTMCDNVPHAKFTYGCNHLSYIQSEHDQLLGSYRAADFVRFYRIRELAAENGGDS